MNKFFLYSLFGGGVVLLVFLGFFFLNKQGNNPESKKEISLEQTILYYGDTCPHCLIVNKFLEENKIREKVSFEHLEVYRNKDNARLLGESAKKCGIDEKQIGVPLLWSEGKCLVGDEDIIDFFKEKIAE